MRIGIPTETKTREYRVGMTPAGVRELVDDGHEVLVQTGAGEGSGIPDAQYLAAGARMVPSAAGAWAADLLVKVKEPQEQEFALMHEGMVLYTYLHLAAEPRLTDELLQRHVTAIAYETIQLADGSLPLLRPMSEVAGRMSVQVGASCLEKERGGKGVLLGGVPGTRRGRVVILGAGVVGCNAAQIASGMGAQVTVLDVRPERMEYLEAMLDGAVETLYSNPNNVEEQVRRADLLIGAVLIPGAAAPRLVSEALVAAMERGSVIVDVAVDQGGCIETCHPTTHDHPTFETHGVVHYCVPNIPGAVSHTSTWALTNATIGYARRIASAGLTRAVAADEALGRGVNTHAGHVTCGPVAAAHKLPYTPLAQLLR